MRGAAPLRRLGPRAGQPSATRGLLAGTSYSYRVRATDAAGNLSAYSNVARRPRRLPRIPQPPTPPSGLTAIAINASQINLSWTAATDDVGVTAYRVLRCQQTGPTADCPNFVRVIQQTGPVTTFADATGLLPSTTYRYIVQAVDGAGNLSAASNEASATTLAASTGLVAAYSFDEGAGTTVADSVRKRQYRNHGQRGLDHRGQVQ